MVTVPAMVGHSSYGASTGLASAHASILSTPAGVSSQWFALSAASTYARPSPSTMTTSSGRPATRWVRMPLRQLAAVPPAYPVGQSMYAQPSAPYLDTSQIYQALPSAAATPHLRQPKRSINRDWVQQEGLCLVPTYGDTTRSQAQNMVEA